MSKTTIIIPSRNEPYLNKTLQDLVEKATGDIEIIVILDGCWVTNIILDDKIHYIHRGSAMGMRNGINSAVELAKGDYLMKTDAHCMFAKGYDEQLIKDHRPNWIQVPRRFPLDPEKWEIEKREDKKYPIDYMRLDENLRGAVWTERNNNPEYSQPIDDLMTFQGSCYFLTKDYYKELELLDEQNYGQFWQEAQEIGLKCWLSGGEVKVNKNTWYAHWHKTGGRGYDAPDDKAKVNEFVMSWKNKGWHKQTKPISWLYEHFDKKSPYSFFNKFGGSGQIRGEQMASRLGAKLNPESGYENDVCIYAKMQPPDNYPKNSYLDIVDGIERLPWLRKHQDIGVICQSKTALEYLEKLLDRKDIILIPEHHCNFERILRSADEVTRVGMVGNHGSVQLPIEELRTRLSEIGVELVDMMYKDTEEKPITRTDIVNFYKSIDIQIVFRPDMTMSEKARVKHNMGDARPLRNPLKLINAMSFGIPTVAYPEEDYVAELDGYFLPATNIDEVIEKVKKLKEDTVLYQTMASAGIRKAEEYHIDNIAKLYAQLTKKEAFMDFKIKGRLWEKEVKVNGFTVPVYGLASFNVQPRSRGFGKQMLIAFEYAAKEDGKYGVVGFCDDSVLSFYTGCGWYTPGIYEGHNIITSFPVKTIEVTEVW